MEYYSAPKRNKLSRHEKTWSKFKCVLLSERRLSEKAVYCMILNDVVEKAKLWTP